MGVQIISLGDNICMLTCVDCMLTWFSNFFLKMQIKLLIYIWFLTILMITLIRHGTTKKEKVYTWSTTGWDITFVKK